jgi:hypothetical protein
LDALAPVLEEVVGSVVAAAMVRLSVLPSPQ